MIGFPPCFLSKFRRFFIDWVPGFPLSFLIKLRKFYHQLNTHNFVFSLPLGLGDFLHQNYDLKRLYACWSLCLREKAIVMSWSHMTSYIMDLTRSRQFHIITYLKVDLLLIIRHLIYLIKSTFQINFLKLTYVINLLIELVMPLVFDTLLFLINVRM